MEIQRTNNEIVIKVNSSVDVVGLQRLIDFISYSEITSKKAVSQSDVDQLASEINKGWWQKNKNNYLKL